MTDLREKTERPDINGEPVAWRFPFDTYHMAHTSDPAEAAKYDTSLQALHHRQTVPQFLR